MKSYAPGLIAVALTALTLTAPVGAQERQAGVDPGTAATIRRLLELTGAAQLALA